MDWNALISGLPLSHLLQTYQWAQIKSQYGWQPFYLIWQENSAGELSQRFFTSQPLRSELQPERVCAAALALYRRIPIRGLTAANLGVMYVPKGPLLDWSDKALRLRVLDDLRALAHKQGAIFLKIDPDVLLGTGVPGQPDASDNPLGQQVVSEMQARGWRYSDEQIQFRNTVLVDLSPSEEQLLANMKQKTRYNVRLAGRRGVEVRPGGLADLDLLYQMYAETSMRDGFVIRDADYYHKVWSLFIQAGMAEPLIAEVKGQPVGAVVVFRHAGKAWYLHGMSLEAHRKKMPNYLLQWEAMRRARQAGCREYDLWGAPETFDERDSLWGVYRFKDGFGGQVVRTIGAWDLPLRPLIYRLYTQVLPRVLDLLRRRGKERTRQSLEAGSAD
ncbi:MAG: peptidoglycan bridge formation glycyltransferase FemA/FemB family protein [Acidobacteriota bacterium]|jgi:peptidoglycan pentaglycine glycine transferase (the first glycine)